MIMKEIRKLTLSLLMNSIQSTQEKAPKTILPFSQSQLGTTKKEGSPLLKTNEKIQDKGKTVDTCFHHWWTPGNGSCIVRPKLKPKRKGNKKQFPP